ncbi:hypothetical protein AB1E19_018352 [Capra hircus]
MGCVVPAASRWAEFGQDWARPASGSRPLLPGTRASEPAASVRGEVRAAERLRLRAISEEKMGKGCKVVVCGLLSVGKTAILEQLLYGNHTIGLGDCETLEDVYMASVETDRGVKEQLHLYDTRGLQEGVELPKHYFSFADGFVLVYSVNNLESFQRVELLKKEIDKFKDKKEVAIVVLGNKIDLSEQRQVDAEVAQQWARSEKVRLWEVTVTDRKTLIEPFTLLASKLSQPQSKSSFPLPGRKNKGNSSSEN